MFFFFFCIFGERKFIIHFRGFFLCFFINRLRIFVRLFIGNFKAKYKVFQNDVWTIFCTVDGDEYYGLVRMGLIVLWGLSRVLGIDCNDIYSRRGN